MIAITKQTEGKTEKQKKLAEVNPGEIFRFPRVSFEQALTQEGEEGFYMVIDTQPKKAGRVSFVSIDGKSVQERDDDHMVVVHQARLEISEADYE